jgi:geranylgeranyl diphosphate synthase type II
MSFDQQLLHYRNQVEDYLNAQLPKVGSMAGMETLHEAMRYTVDGGKRIRPIITLAACEAVGGNLDHALPTACAIELFHAYSLVHDDLPSMDDDDERRGKPTVHRKYDEATAILVGDALLTLGFEWISTAQAEVSDATKSIRVIRRLSNALGTMGMVGGQHLDLTQEFKTSADLLMMQDLKTGAMLSVAAEVGAILGGAGEKNIELLSMFGLRLGQTFQLVDDLLDVEQDKNQNASMLDFETKEDVQASAEVLNQAALACLESFDERGMWLKSLAKTLLFRNN